MSNTYRKADVCFCVDCGLPTMKGVVGYGEICECRYERELRTVINTDGSREKMWLFRFPNIVWHTNVDVHDHYKSMYRSNMSSRGHNTKNDIQVHKNRSFRRKNTQVAHQLVKEFNAHKPSQCECVYMGGRECDECSRCLQNHKSTKFPEYKNSVMWDFV